jgi:hypothetical protein
VDDGQMGRADNFRDLPATDPADFRLGVLFGWMIFALGIMYVLMAIYVAVDDARGSLSFVVYMMVMAGVFAGSGLLLIRKAKLGLWGLYLLSAYKLVSFSAASVKNAVEKIPGGAPKAIVDASLLLLWFLIVGYFYKRRRQFTRVWGGASAAVAGG